MNEKKEPRPNIPKLTIKHIGEVNADGSLANWVFEGSKNPAAIGHYISEDWEIISGYTADELRSIAAIADKKAKEALQLANCPDRDNGMCIKCRWLGRKVCSN